MDIDSVESFYIEILSKALEKLDIPTFNVKMEENPMVDIPESSRGFRPRYMRTPTARGTVSVSGAVKEETNSPMDKLRPKGINPFGIYLDLDCNPNILST